MDKLWYIHGKQSYVCIEKMFDFLNILQLNNLWGEKKKPWKCSFRNYRRKREFTFTSNPLSFKVSSGSRSHFSVKPTPDMGIYTRMKGLAYNDQGSHHNLTGNSKAAVFKYFPRSPSRCKWFSRNPPLSGFKPRVSLPCLPTTAFRK